MASNCPQSADPYRCLVAPPPRPAAAGITERLLGPGATDENARSLGLIDLVDLECQVADVLDAMSAYGVAVDVSLARRLRARWTERIEEVDARYPDVNLGSPVQVLGLFRHHGLSLQDTKRTTLDSHAEHPVVADLLARREADALAKFARHLLDHLHDDGRVHPTYDHLGAATGRITASNPPVQQIPVRTEAGREIRGALIAGAGRVLISADYSQVELRILAALSGEPTLLDAFGAGDDVHERVATECGVDRRTAKAINYGLIYGQTEFGLARTLGCGRGQARRYIQQYFNVLPRVSAYLDGIACRARHYGASWTRHGRCRALPDALGRGSQQRTALRQATNHVMQGTAADLYKEALVAVAGTLPGDSRIVLPIHDEIVVEAPADQASEVAALVRSTMESAGDLGLPLVADVGWGATLADAK